MIAHALSRSLARHGLHYGWVVVGVTFLVNLVSAGAVGLPGTLIRPLTEEFGWNTGEISGALAMRFLLYGLMAPFSAALIDRYGVRRIVLAAITLVMSGLALALAMSEVWQLVLLWGVVVGLGTGLTALVLSAIVATRWFAARRGLVLGILAASTASGQLVFLPLAAWLVDRFGWRYALLPPLLGLALVLCLAMLFLRDRPADLGLLPYGEDAGDALKIGAEPAHQAAYLRAFAVLREVAPQPAFWILFATFLVCGLSTAGLVQTHLIGLCVDNGMPAIAAASTLAMIGFFDFFGTIGSGWLSDRFDNRALLFWYYGLRGLSLLYLPFSTFTFYGLSLFAVFYGLDWIATVPPTIRLSAKAFGREKAGIAFGWIFTGHQIGSASAAFGAGVTRAVFSTYLPAFLVSGALCLVAAGLVWLLRKDPSIGSAAVGRLAAAE
jgi:sugar phosphate permease